MRSKLNEYDLKFLEYLFSNRQFSNSENKELIKSAKTNENIREKLIIHNQKLVLKVSYQLYQYFFENNELLDLVSYGNLGLINAIDNYDISKIKNNDENYINAYFALNIRSFIVYSLYRTKSQLYIPYYVYLVNRNIKKYNDEYFLKNGKMMTNRDLFNMIKWKAFKHIDYFSFLKIRYAYDFDFISIDEILDKNFGINEHHLISYHFFKDDFYKFLKKILNKEMYNVITLKFGLYPHKKEHKINEISNMLNLKKTKVENLIKRSLEILENNSHTILYSNYFKYLEEVNYEEI